MLVFNAVFFYILVSVFSGGKEREARFQIFAIAIVMIVMQSYVMRKFPTTPALLGVLGAQMVVAWVALDFWIKVEKLAAVKIVTSYVGACLALAFVLATMMPRLG